MPIHTGQDKNGNFYQWGKTGKKYYFKPGDEVSRKRARGKAETQQTAIYSSGWKGDKQTMKLIKVKCKDDEKMSSVRNKKDGELVKKDKQKDGCWTEVWQNSAGNLWWRFVIPNNYELLKYYPKNQRYGAEELSKKFYIIRPGISKQQLDVEIGHAETDALLELHKYQAVLFQRAKFFKENYPEYQNQK